MPVLESTLERKCRQYAIAHKCLFLKLQGTKGFPDRLLLFPDGYGMFIEFKQLNLSPSPLQQFYLDLLEDMHYHVNVVDNFPMFKRIIDGRFPTSNVVAT